MMHRNLKRFIYVRRTDDMVVRFPVSEHFLTLKKPLRKARGWTGFAMKQGLALALVLCLCGSSFGIASGSIDNTISFFRDVESSNSNQFQAGSLDFVVSPNGDVSAIMAQGSHVVVPIMTPEPGSLPIRYRVTAEETGGSHALCQALDAKATTAPFIYNGDLLALSVVATTTTGPWHLEISLPDATGLSNGDECQTDIVYRGWEKDAPEGTGYTDEERLSLTVTYQAAANPFDIVLNEFLPNPDDSANGLDFGNDSASMPKGEWIELYNKGGVPQNISGWYMTDASGGVGNTHAIITALNTQPATTTILAHGWLVVYLNKPSLNNTGDDIFLYTDTDVQVDTYSYDDPSDFCENEPTPGSTDASSTPSGTPGPDCITNQVAPNKSYARIPDGTGAFVDPIPTPGSRNIPDPEPQGQVLGESSAPPEGSAAPAETVGLQESQTEPPSPPSPEPEETGTDATTPPETPAGGGPTAGNGNTNSETPPESSENSGDSGNADTNANPETPPVDTQGTPPADTGTPDIGTPDPENTDQGASGAGSEITDQSAPPPADPPPPPPPVDPPPATIPDALPASE